MAVVFDTESVTVAERVDAFRAVIVDATVPSSVVLDPPAVGVPLSARLTTWRLGRVQALRTQINHGMELARSPRQTRMGCTPMISLAVPTRNAGRHEQFDRVRTVPVGTLSCVDLTAPYRFTQPHRHAGCALQIPIDELDLPMDVVRRAAAALPSSPLYELMTAHVTALTRVPDRLDPQVAAGMGRSAIELARSLLLSAAGGRQSPAEGAALLAQVRAYIARHLADEDLGPDVIAAALHVSVRHLYSVCARDGFSIEQWIIGQRLEKAKNDLASPASANRTVATIAHRWGFRDPAHFSRRFRLAYGITPTGWRAVADGDQGHS
ncbi:helix-turn-helix domain-containing protein [Micromonospora sp. PLK6-60]|uniref:helix-turn-helix domain-containing protein n=1 Tax=Micromonospora sp. PLK6-60 TaxID=2873383 RepID=UPI001CA731FD|nr:helix-turn-helix domain-containing protein [Micromonospora sp. PLK6-60]MBY8870570.1 helix-turn-helix domain-containing protein [Micromonospora sp. PLK6-60]